MILPSYLIQLGYGAIQVVKELESKSFVQPWSDLRGIFEYLSCVEYARQKILELPTGSGIGSVDIVPARYNSASLVFFCQATLDNLAVWLNANHKCGLSGNNISFYKNQLKKLLKDINVKYKTLLDEKEEFIQRLNKYRMTWLHRLAGGAEIYSDKNPSDSEADIVILISIDPEIPSLRSDPQRYLNRIQKIQSKNGGKWLMPIDQFANEMTEETKSLVWCPVNN